MSDTTTPWRQVEIALAATTTYAKPYVDLEAWAEFTHDDGTRLQRPAFWDGGSTWRVRFAADRPGQWRWASASSADDEGLAANGTITVAPAGEEQHRFFRHGFWRMSPGGRSLVHADGAPAVLVADTAWALPWRATPEHVQVYAQNRQSKGFNAALLMSVQPDMRAAGPRERTQDEGFGVGFEDLPYGHLNQINVDYFTYLDGLLAILVEHEIVPVLQPVFQGFGWKGLDVAGVVVPPQEYARYCRYLVARYGAQPAIWLVGADGSGEEPQVEAGGHEVQRVDAYQQPTGIHYRPHARAEARQAADWLDFQWCQTGHRGEHVPERVADMWRNEPVKAVANGEPTYEGTRSPDVAAGWWQGDEAWRNLCAGGTMGVVYGAANIWQWKLHGDEPGHAPYFLAESGGWRESLDFEGSRYVGLLGKILDGLPTTDMEPDWESVISPSNLRAGDSFFLLYSDVGGDVPVHPGIVLPRSYYIVDPQTGHTLGQGDLQPGQTIPSLGAGPRVYILLSHAAVAASGNPQPIETEGTRSSTGHVTAP